MDMDHLFKNMQVLLNHYEMNVISQLSNISQH